jgi:predicted RNA polymerase sigma factor
VHGPEHGLELLRALERDSRIAEHHRLAAVRAHLHERAGRREEAVRLYREAAAKTASVPERDYLLVKAAKLGVTINQ